MEVTSIHKISIQLLTPENLFSVLPACHYARRASLPGVAESTHIILCAGLEGLAKEATFTITLASLFFMEFFKVLFFFLFFEGRSFRVNLVFLTIRRRPSTLRISVSQTAAARSASRAWPSAGTGAEGSGGAHLHVIGVLLHGADRRIDDTRTTSNDIVEIIRILGVEAVRDRADRLPAAAVVPVVLAHDALRAEFHASRLVLHRHHRYASLHGLAIRFVMLLHSVG